MAIDIIKGEQYAITGGNPDGGFLDVGAVVSEAADKVLKVVDKERAQGQIASNRRRAEAEKANRRISSYLSKMKSGSDIEGLNKEQNKVIKDFLVNKKNTYVEAANKLATMSPGDPGYMEQVDIMNSVNQDITNLSNISKTYKLNQKDLLEDHQENLLSMGDPLRLNQSASIYHPSAIFSLDENGSMIFDVNGKKIDYADFNNPAPKATSSATAILKLTDNVYSSSFRNGQALNQYKLANIRSQIEEVVGGNPDIARSLVMDNLLTNTPLAINEKDYNDPDKLQTTLVNNIMEGILAASNKGVSDYNSKNRNTNNTNNENKLEYNIGVLKAIKGGAKGVETNLYDAITGTKSFKPDAIIYDQTGYYIFDKNGNKLVIINENGALGKDAARFGVTSLDQLK